LKIGERNELLLFPVVVRLNLWEEKWFIDGKIILLYSPKEVAMAVHLVVPFMIASIIGRRSKFSSTNFAQFHHHHHHHHSSSSSSTDPPDSCKQPAGKLLVLDEAHKFMNDDTTTDGLSASIVNIARLMRHDGDVSTQSPKTLAPELLELVSVTVLHHFHSHDWFKYLAYRSFPWRRVCGRKSSDFLPVSLSGFRLATSRRR
jgi:hypothetical protein